MKAYISFAAAANVDGASNQFSVVDSFGGTYIEFARETAREKTSIEIVCLKDVCTLHEWRVHVSTIRIKQQKRVRVSAILILLQDRSRMRTITICNNGECEWNLYLICNCGECG